MTTEPPPVPRGASTKFAVAVQRPAIITTRPHTLTESAIRFVYCQGVLPPGFDAPIRATDDVLFFGGKSVATIVLTGHVRNTTASAWTNFLNFLITVKDKGSVGITVLEFGDWDPIRAQALFEARTAASPAPGSIPASAASPTGAPAEGAPVAVGS